MQIALSQHAKDFVEEKLLAVIKDEDLRQSLLDVARGPFVRYRPGEFVELAERVIAEQGPRFH